MKTKIVWNLTNGCPFSCSICAAAANSRETKNVDKDRILESILTIFKNNVFIDFSGGDPLMDKRDIYLIKRAKDIIGKENISISTTGLSLEKLKDDEVLELSQSYDLTYDFPVRYNDLDKRDKRYNDRNFDQGRRISRLGLDLNLFVPLQHMEEYLVDELVKDLIELNPKTISIIRLMPVGYLFNEDLVVFDEINAFNVLKSKLLECNYKGEIKATCSLRTLIGEEKGCNMISTKYGVDHLGNLYSCIWGADILDDDNPFFLGNLLENDMSLLTVNKNIKFKKNDCAVYQYVKKRRRTNS